MFVALILDQIYSIYDSAVLDVKPKKLVRMAKMLNLEVPDRELRPDVDPRGAARAFFRRWLPLASAVLQVAVDHMPSPDVAQRSRVDCLWAPDCSGGATTTGVAHGTSGSARKPSRHGLRQAVSECARGLDEPVVAFVSKMATVLRSELEAAAGGGTSAMVAHGDSRGGKGTRTWLAHATAEAKQAQVRPCLCVVSRPEMTLKLIHKVARGGAGGTVGQSLSC